MERKIIPLTAEQRERLNGIINEIDSTSKNEQLIDKLIGAVRTIEVETADGEINGYNREYANRLRRCAINRMTHSTDIEGLITSDDLTFLKALLSDLRYVFSLRDVKDVGSHFAEGTLRSLERLIFSKLQLIVEARTVQKKAEPDVRSGIPVNIKNLKVDDYVEGYEYYGNGIRKTRGWVDSVSPREGRVSIQADDGFEGHRGTTLYEELGTITRLANEERPNLI